MFRKLAFAAVLAAATIQPAAALISGNGKDINGVTPNGKDINGKDINGKDINGVERGGTRAKSDAGLQLLAIELPPTAQ